MSDQATTEADPSGRLDEAIAQYLEAVDAGKAPDPIEFARRYPEIAGELAAALADARQFEELIAPLRLESSTEEASGPDPGDTTAAFNEESGPDPGDTTAA